MQSIRNGEKIAGSFYWEALALEPFRGVLYYETTILEVVPEIVLECMLF